MENSFMDHQKEKMDRLGWPDIMMTDLNIKNADCSLQVWPSRPCLNSCQKCEFKLSCLTTRFSFLLLFKLYKLDRFYIYIVTYGKPHIFSYLL